MLARPAEDRRGERAGSPSASQRPLPPPRRHLLKEPAPCSRRGFRNLQRPTPVPPTSPTPSPAELRKGGGRRTPGDKQEPSSTTPKRVSGQGWDKSGGSGDPLEPEAACPPLRPRRCVCPPNSAHGGPATERPGKPRERCPRPCPRRRGSRPPQPSPAQGSTSPPTLSQPVAANAVRPGLRRCRKASGRRGLPRSCSLPSRICFS